MVMRSKKFTVRLSTQESAYLMAVAKELNTDRSEALRILIRSEYEVMTGKASSGKK